MLSANSVGTFVGRHLALAMIEFTQHSERQTLGKNTDRRGASRKMIGTGSLCDDRQAEK